ncbi:HTTM domain-containing protein [Actinomycetospora straminea]|uniref:Vitamin K-dependent gamma-carboxylase-like protein n=1 Tax=Actinomycetospora straminea TaxID=663607 RepID=A0ABP9F8E3_9PSEU|nr:HTTM domain-containing protein [Actinomycetospora straminea]MDD7936680.1 HTTM domain-containing protein [Actinomycetospora straminea]
MTQTQLVRLTAIAQPEPEYKPYRSSAFTVFAVALAVGAIVHEWNSTWTPWVAVPVTVAALAVLVKPSSTVRFMVLTAALVAECVRQMPDPVNHQILLGLLGVTLGLWWLGLLATRPRVALDPGLLYDRIAPFLRLAFILMWVLAALAKVNAGFLDTASTCAVWIVESIPLVTVPAMVVPAVIAGTLAMELSLPILLAFHRTRPYAVMVALPFHALSALAGHSWFSGLAWAFYALFLPPVVLARGLAVGRTVLPAWLRRGLDGALARPWTTVVVGGLAYVVGHDVVVPALGPWDGGARHWGAVVVCLTWMGFTSVVLWWLRHLWFPGVRRPRATLRVGHPVLVLGLVALVLNGASPYLGLKTEAAFTMFSNIRTEPGHWNPLLVPESVRVVGWLEGGDVRFTGTDDPVLAAEIADDESGSIVLMGARRLVSEHPEATVSYTLDGVPRVAAPVAADPVLGRPLSLLEEWFGATRPYTEGGTCQH